MSRREITALHLAALLLLSYLFLFHGIGAYSLKEPDEGRYAEIPREMVESGNYIVPYLNYSPGCLFLLQSVGIKTTPPLRSTRFPSSFVVAWLGIQGRELTPQGEKRLICNYQLCYRIHNIGNKSARRGDR